jgi:hypothetical protein
MGEGFGHMAYIKAQHIHGYAANERHFLRADITHRMPAGVAQIAIGIAARHGGDARPFGQGLGGAVAYRLFALQCAGW